MEWNANWLRRRRQQKQQRRRWWWFDSLLMKLRQGCIYKLFMLFVFSVFFFDVKDTLNSADGILLCLFVPLTAHFIALYSNKTREKKKCIDSSEGNACHNAKSNVDVKICGIQNWKHFSMFVMEFISSVVKAMRFRDETLVSVLFIMWNAVR